MANTSRDFEMEQMFGKENATKPYLVDLKECMICNNTQHINKDGLCPFCQLDIDLNIYDT